MAKIIMGMTLLKCCDYKECLLIKDLHFFKRLNCFKNSQLKYEHFRCHLTGNMKEFGYKELKPGINIEGILSKALPGLYNE